MSTKPNQGKNPDQDGYGGYAGYQPRKPKDDPYGAYHRPDDTQQGGTAGTAGGQSDPNYVYGQKQSYGSASASSSQQQQYQPPSSVTGKRYGSSSQGSMGAGTRTRTRLKPNRAAALSYLGVFFTGLFFLFWRRQDRLVRFSAAQSIVLFLPLFIITAILNAFIGLIATIPLIGLLAPLLSGTVFVIIILPGILVWLFLMVQALRGVEVKLPYVGKYAEWLSGVFAPRRKNAGN